LSGLLVGGWAAAHGLAYQIVVPDGTERRHVLETTGHGYFDSAAVVSLCITLVALGLIVCAVQGRVETPAPGLAAALPLGGFVVQEHLERLLHEGAFPFAAASEPTFVVGLLLQLPFALAALFAARILLVATAALVRRLRRTSLGRPLPGPAVPGPVAHASAPRIGLLALGHGQRAPPPFVLR
jgi:hypothetical protein